MKAVAQRRRRLELLLVLIFFSCSSGVIAAREPAVRDAAPDLYLGELAFNLRDQPAWIRAELALAAITEMAEAYSLEAERARLDVQRKGRKQDLRSWTYAVDGMARELAELANSLTSSSPVHIGVSQENSVYLVVDGHPLIVNGPRMHDQAALEQRIVERFCSFQPCARWMPEPLDAASEALQTAGSVTTHWSFSEDSGPVCMTDDGLQFRFQSMTDIGWKRRQCQRVVTDLHVLAKGISQRKRSGVKVDWESVAVVAVTGSDQQRVELNRDGDYFTAWLPGLSASDKLFVLLRPWLAAKVNGNDYSLVVRDAGNLLLPAAGIEIYSMSVP